MKDEHEQTLDLEDCPELRNRFRLATNGVVMITNCGDVPIVMIGAGSFN